MGNVCNYDKLKALFEVQTTQLEITNSKLKDIHNAGKIESADLKSLFPIDPLDEAAAAAFIDELKKKTWPKFEEQYPKCTKIKALLSSHYNKLLALQNNIKKNRLQFLQLPIKQRQLLLNISLEKNKLSEIKKKFADEQVQAVQEQRKAMEARSFAEPLGNMDLPPGEKEFARKLAEQIVQVSQRSEEMAAQKLALSIKYEQRLDQIQDYKKSVQSQTVILAREKSEKILSKAYKDTVISWRKIVDLGPGGIQLISEPGQNKIPGASALLKLKFPGKKVPDSIQKIYTRYSELYDGYIKNYQSFSLTQKKRQQELITYYYSLLMEASNLRSEYINAVAGFETINLISLDLDIINDLAREIQVVPNKFFALFFNRLIEFNHNLAEGISGIVKIIKNLLIVLLILLSPFVLFKIIKYFSLKIGNLQKKIIQVRRPPPLRLKLSLWLKWLIPYMPYILAYLSIGVIDSLLKNTLLEELTIVLPYFRIFIYYRVFIILFQTGLRRTVLRSKGYTLLQYENRIHTTARTIGLFLFIVALILHTAESTVGRAIIYHIVENLLYVIGILILIISSYKWRNEIGEAVTASIKNTIAQKINGLVQGPPGLVLSLPLLVLLLAKITIRKLFHLLFELDLIKKIIARLLRRQMKAAGASVKTTDINSLPDEYRNLFSFGVPRQEDIWINPESTDLEACTDFIRKWASGESTESTIAIYGEKGIGKSSLLELLARNIEVNFIKAVIPPKLITAPEVLAYFETLLQFNAENDIANIQKWDKTASKTVLLLDDAHNFFLSRIKGFEGFRLFLEIINLQLDNILICATFNIHSWMFLDSVFGRNKYFRNVLRMSPWNENDIMDLIITRHNKSSYTLQYDPVIAASSLYSDTPGGETTRRKFFRLLWDQTDGNPRSALYTWLTCLSFYGDSISVGLPLEPVESIFHDLQSDTLFVYAAIIKHENLSTDEAVLATQLPRGFVDYALKLGLERDFLHYDSSKRYRINPGWHGTVVDFLKERNYLYVI